MMICCADIGSVANGKFGWAGHPAEPDGQAPSGRDMEKFAEFVARGLAVHKRVSLGFECPLWIPVADEPSRLTRARPGEGNRAWSAGAGSTSLSTGLAQVVWILDRIRRQSEETEVFLDWKCFQRSQSGLFIWEAFVTGGAKGGSDPEDAMAGVNAFRRTLPDPELKNAVRRESRVRSLIGAALLWSRWSTDTRLLHEPCLVIRA